MITDTIEHSKWNILFLEPNTTHFLIKARFAPHLKPGFSKHEPNTARQSQSTQQEATKEKGTSSYMESKTRLKIILILVGLLSLLLYTR